MEELFEVEKQKSKKSPGGERNEAFLGLPCGRQKEFCRYFERKRNKVKGMRQTSDPLETPLKHRPLPGLPCGRQKDH